MAEKVQAETVDIANPAVPGVKTQEKPKPEPAEAKAPGGGGPANDEKPSDGPKAPPRPGGTISPVEHHKVHGESMADPNGDCQACGKPTPEGARTCPACSENPQSWNQKVDQQDEIWRGLGKTDDEIRQLGDELFGGYKAQGKNAEFQKQLDDALGDD